MLTRILALAAATFTALTFAASAADDGIPVPQGDVILTLSGEIGTTNVGDTLQFDRETFVALGLQKVETSTIWTDGAQVFEGVSLSSLIERLGIEDGILFATAINDYTVEVPVSDAVEGGPIVAVLHNGEEMSVRDKGPLWIIYPYDKSSDYRSEVIYSRSIWQLDRINVDQYSKE
jgi:hypothetical protein